MSAYVVTFDRVGRRRNLPPLTVDTDPVNLPGRILAYAQPHLPSGTVDVEIDLVRGRGHLWVNQFNSAGAFTIAATETADTL
jgi:hypothetical protein